MSSDTERASVSSQENATAHRNRIKDHSFLGEEKAQEEVTTLEPNVDALRTLVDEVEGRGTAFQSVLIAAVQILERALCYERDAADAALSLGQQEKLDSMVETGNEAVQVLRNALSSQGREVMRVCGEEKSSLETEATSSGQPWWFALSDALEVLEEGTGRMSSLTTAQPDGSPARRLSQLTTQLLRHHHDELLIEADEWIT